MIYRNPVLKGIASSSSVQRPICNNLLFSRGVFKFLIGGAVCSSSVASGRINSRDVVQKGTRTSSSVQ